jgi:hypothetical protein
MLPTPPEDASKVEALETEQTSTQELPGVPESTSSGNTADTVGDFVEEAKVWGWWIFDKLQIAGEFVAGVLGLDESRYNYVINNMTEEDWKVARKVQAKREAQLAGRPYEEMEGGDTTQPIEPPAPPTVVEVANAERSGE